MMGRTEKDSGEEGKPSSIAVRLKAATKGMLGDLKFNFRSGQLAQDLVP